MNSQLAKVRKKLKKLVTVGVFGVLISSTLFEELFVERSFYEITGFGHLDGGGGLVLVGKDADVNGQHFGMQIRIRFIKTSTVTVG